MASRQDGWEYHSIVTVCVITATNYIMLFVEEQLQYFFQLLHMCVIFRVIYPYSIILGLSYIVMFCMINTFLSLEIQCETPETPPNCYVDAESISFRSTIFYRCQKGFAMTSGDNNRTCQADGSWSGTQPTCAGT